MPKVKNPLLSMEARGGIAGLVYNTWRGINTVKTNTSPTGQGTEKRLAAQALLIQASQLWKGLSDSQRSAWRQYAIDHPVADWTGSPKRLTGMNWFCSLAITLLRFGGTPIEDPPTGNAPDAVSGLAVAQTATDITCTWSDPTDAGLNLQFFAVGPLSAGIAAKIEQTKYLTTVSAPDAQPITLVADAAVGRWTFFVSVWDETTGQVSTFVSDYVDVT